MVGSRGCGDIIWKNLDLEEFREGSISELAGVSWLLGCDIRVLPVFVCRPPYRHQTEYLNLLAEWLNKIVHIHTKSVILDDLNI